MKGYKAFDENLKCRNMQYEVGKTYEMGGSPNCCVRGFHFCKNLACVYDYYQASDNIRICEVSAQGEIVQEGNKYCTNKIKIVREIKSKSIKHCNADGSEDGFLNTGSRNAGYWNTGYRNTGYWNTGDWNAANYSSGCFCTEEPEMLLFDKPSGMTLKEFRKTEAYDILCCAPADEKYSEWDENQQKIVTIKKKADVQGWYDGLEEEKKDVIKSMVNFDADKFYQCTGIRV